MNNTAINEATNFFLIIGVIFGFGNMTLSDVDLLFGIALKFISIISFTVVIVINIPNFVKTIKKPFQKNNDGQ